MFVHFKFTYLSHREFNEINCWLHPVQSMLAHDPPAAISAHPHMSTCFPEPHHFPDQ